MTELTDQADANWVTLKEASARAGVSISWLRKQYRHNGLPTRDIVGSRGLQKSVPLTEVLARAAVFTTNGPGPPPTGPPPEPAHPGSELSSELTAVLLDRLFDAQGRAARAEAECAYLLLKLDDAYAEIDQLRTRLGD